MKDLEPRDYQFQHEYRLRVSDGVGDGVVFSAPVSDGFMKVADMRTDIIVSGMSERVKSEYEYSEKHQGPISFINVGEWRKKGETYSRRDNSLWVIAMDEDAIHKKAQINERPLVTIYAQELQKGLRTTLVREKMLNGGVYSLPFINSYVMGNIPEAFCIPNSIEQLADGHPGKAVLWGGFLLFGNAFVNVANRMAAQYAEKDLLLETELLPKTNDPFIPHTIPDLFFPAIPVHRLVSGTVYLKARGNDLVSRKP